MNKFRKFIIGALLLALCFSFLNSCVSAREFTYATDLEDGRVQAETAYSFRLSVLYGKKLVTPEVTCNGILLTADGDAYTASLHSGENEIAFSAQRGNDRISRTYRITCEAELTYTTDLEDGRVQPDEAYSFRLSVLYGDKTVTPEVTCNGILLTADGDAYTALLRNGGNEISFSAQQGQERLTRTYRVTRKAEFAFSEIPEDLRIENDRISFAAGATFNGAPCALLVKHNDKELEPENGNYTAELSAGDNTLTMIARAGDYTETKEWHIAYDGFVFITNLENADTGNPELSFRAAARYGESVCDLSVTVNGEPLTPDGGRYSLVLAPGENRFVLTVSSGNATKRYEYTVRYVDAAPALTANITDGKTYKSGTYSFDVTAKDGLGKKLPASAISFLVDWDAGDGVDNFVPVSGISLVWDDSVMTSFRIRFRSGVFASHTGVPFALKIVATDDYGRSAVAVYRMTADPVGEGEQSGEVVFSLEGFSIGCGYFIAPVRVPVYEGVPFSRTLTEILTAHGWTYTYTGSIESGFYLASVGGLNLKNNRIADGIWDFVKDRGYVRSIAEDGTLGEFDFGSGSGWMYSVNGVYKNYGFADYFPQDGDTVRVQFTVMLGEDLGGGGALGGGSSGSLLDDNPDYALIMKMLADIAQGSADKTVYHEVLSAISAWNLSQNEMERQIGKLKSAYGEKG